MPKRPSNPPHPRLPEEEMWRRFNEGQYWARMQAGEFTEHLIRESADIEHREILERYPDARSVTARYRHQDGTDIVEVHYYVQYPSGPIIPNKRPDPKLLFEDGVLYHREKLKNRVKRLAAEAEARAHERSSENLP